MRIVHLSDIHLSKENYTEFQNNYKDALIKDLKSYHSSIPIDLIVITGDLVDRGGHSLFEIPEFTDKGYISPYDIFNEVFIVPILEKLGITKDRFLFIPGNHDINEKEILLYEECEMLKNITNDNIKEYLQKNKTFTYSHRIRKFKEFEEKYHQDTDSYIFTNNQSTYIYKGKEDVKVGFLLVNDSWRCKSAKINKEDGTHYFGIQQLHDGLEILEKEGTELNICLLHHYVDNFKEAAEVKGFFERKHIELLLYGHYHNPETNIFYTPYGTCKGFRGRATLLNPNEKNSTFQPGYQIMDIDLRNFKLNEIHYRKYNNRPEAKLFVADVDIAPENGIDKNKLNNGNGFDLPREGRKNNLSTLDKTHFKA
jgi:predicted MPP superfamily phosphohydrolase